MRANQIAVFTNHDIPRECLNRKLSNNDEDRTAIATAAKELNFPTLYHDQKAAITRFVEGNVRVKVRQDAAMFLAWMHMIGQLL